MVGGKHLTTHRARETGYSSYSLVNRELARESRESLGEWIGVTSRFVDCLVGYDERGLLWMADVNIRV